MADLSLHPRQLIYTECVKLIPLLAEAATSQSVHWLTPHSCDLLPSHFDFIPLECYAGLSEDHYAHVELLGLEVPDCERVVPEEKRSNKTLKEYVWMTVG